MGEETLHQLATDAWGVARERFRIPTATYRLQMHKGFTLRHVRALVPYFHDLGISHLYVSSLLTARPDSTHGYDVMDHGSLNPELGDEADLAGLVADLRARGMGLLLDTVPNHMCVTGPNAWWEDVLENGPSSPYSGYFDIAWSDHPRTQLRNKVLLPILGDTYGKTLRDGLFRIEFADGAFFLSYFGHRLPLGPRTYHLVLGPALDAARQELGVESEGVVEMQSILLSIHHLPTRDIEDPQLVAQRRLETRVIKRRLSELARSSPAMFRHVQRAVGWLSGVGNDPGRFAAMDQLIDAQAYRPSFWRVASDEINYRRFFDINDLAALSTEREDVFRAIHRKIFDWLRAGWIDGLRIDHPDGLYDPRQYLARIQVHYLLALAEDLLRNHSERYSGLTWDVAQASLHRRFEAAFESRTSTPALFVVVEKILAAEEKLPDNWLTHGTSGYEFLNVVNGLFVQHASVDSFTTLFEMFTGIEDSYTELSFQNKYLVLQSALTSELHMLAHQLDRLAQSDWTSKDFTLNGLRHALRVVIACFPVYRSYIDGIVTEHDRKQVLNAIRRARRRSAVLDRKVFDFIRDTLLLKDPPSGPASDEYRAAQVRFAGKFQQVTAPVTAKGLEDTTFYVYNRLASLNEVGGEPDRFGWTPAHVHQFFKERQARFPAGLSPLSTHDTKRGEDVRARINVLSEIPELWEQRLERWANLNRLHKTEIEESVIAPDPNEELLLYQTLVGVWPADPNDASNPAFVNRIKAYMQKALREAKVHSSWIHPDAEYDAAVEQFVDRILDSRVSAEFLNDLCAFQDNIGRCGLINSLAQTLVHLTAPGTPDIYQGTELFDDNLVDPDNRRPVDFALRQRWLQEGPRDALLESAWDGRAKLFVMSRALRFRREHAALFAEGTYDSAEASGPRLAHLFAFFRSQGDVRVLVIVPRLVAWHLWERDIGTLGPDFWRDTTITIPIEGPSRWENILTGDTVVADGSLSVAEALGPFAVGLLKCTHTGRITNEAS